MILAILPSNNPLISWEDAAATTLVTGAGLVLYDWLKALRRRYINFFGPRKVCGWSQGGLSTFLQDCARRR